MYGRGTADQKAGIAAMIYALKTIMDLDIKLKGDVLIGTTIEKEDGGIGGASGGVLYFRIKIYGKTAHAATVHLGVNAIEKSFLIYDALMELNRKKQERIRYPYAEDISPHMKGRVTTISVGVIRGDWPSTVAG